MQPPPGELFQRFTGDRIRFVVGDGDGRIPEAGWRARLRTNLGRGDLLNREIIEAHTRGVAPAGASWHDLPMRLEEGKWTLELPLIEPGYFQAKAYLIDPGGWQHWPEGPDINVSVHPDSVRTANTIYCAFTRMFGESRNAARTIDENRDQKLKELDDLGYTVIPPSGKFRDLIRQLPHIMETLGCRILHLLPVNPTPTTCARYGRFGSPYASLDLTGIDPALVDFDRRTTGVDQFCELADAVHVRGGRLFLDIVMNHTGWESQLQADHPEWFARTADGSFLSPGAWGTIWEDLVELEHRHVPLWDCLSEALLTWCRRGVDGFRCDAGYKVPLPAWQFITARVRREFPETVFLLEGLGGAWETTEQLLARGGMQWAYSELFQNYSGAEVATYTDHIFKQDGRAGLLVNYSETHDNERLAGRGRAWSLLRNRLCALASVSGGYGFTCGVEWLAPERVNVHSSRGLAWGNPDHLVGELARLNALLAGHPCFFDHASLTRLSPPDSPVYALRRVSAEGCDAVLVLANNDLDQRQSVVLDGAQVPELEKLAYELTGGSLPLVKFVGSGKREFVLEPGASHCLSSFEEPLGLAGGAYRDERARAAWGLAALGETLPINDIPGTDWRQIARLVAESPFQFLAACSPVHPGQIAGNLERLTAGEALGGYEAVVRWSLPDCRRVLPVPPGHWLLIEDSLPFRATLEFGDGKPAKRVRSVPVHGGQVACFDPAMASGEALIVVERFAAGVIRTEGRIRFLAPGPKLNAPGGKPLAISSASEIRLETESPIDQPLVLLTNGIGGMARMCVDFGAIKSKYDCLLAANLNPRVPVDRHVFVKRARAWVNAEGFITPLNAGNLVSFDPGAPAVWSFVANAGDGRTVEIRISAWMPPGRNTTVLKIERPRGNGTAVDCSVGITVRLDLEDRNFHSETRRNSGADYHFSSNSRPFADRCGFEFTPASDRCLRAYSSSGAYHHEAEWCENIPHPVEQSRGQTGTGDAYSPGWFDLPALEGAEILLVVCADATDPSPDELIPTTPQNPSGRATPFGPDDIFGHQLSRAADAYVVRRDDGITVIAGYPWFLDWGRDSLICARGLLADNRIDEVRQLLVTFGRFARAGTLPNTIHGDDASNRDTSDAPLWYGIVCEEAAALAGAELYQTKAGDENATIAGVLKNIAEGYIRGTPNGIRMDPQSGLIWSPSHFTWMDTNFPAGTPREGYPIEIQVLWIRLLRQLDRIEARSTGARWCELADLAEASLHKYFWLEEHGYLADLLIARANQPADGATVDNALRSNCLLAVSLGLLAGERARRCVTAAMRYLVVPGALRSLAPLPVSPPLPIYGNQGQQLNDPANPYWGRYEGDEDTRRKPAYHNGTAWTWTFPTFCEALARAWDCAPDAVRAAKAHLGGMDRLVMEGCVGQIPEVLDGDAPHTQRGCDAQAWGVTEALRVWRFLQKR